MNRLYVQLCRAGDLINLAPILFQDHQDGLKPGIMVHRDYVSVLSGCSYAEVVPFDGGMFDLARAMQAAKTLCSDVRCTQVIADTEAVKEFTYGPAGQTKHETDSFAKEPYKLLGRMDVLKKQPRPVFDKRNKKREAALTKLVPKPEKTILVSLNGTTSPFPYKDLLFELLRLRFKDRYNVFDLSQIRAEFIYDFLGLFSKAACLVACDSALLHLAYAVPTLPVVALVQDRPNLWHGAPWRSNHICHIRYGDFAKRATELLDAIEGIGKSASTFRRINVLPKYLDNVNKGLIVHAWSGYELNEENKPRYLEARKTWEHEYRNGPWVETQTEPGAIGRDSKNSLVKDTTRYPFLNDVIRLACYRAQSPDDIICLTRSHTCFEKGFTLRLLGAKLPVWSHRLLRNGHGDTFHPACDIFAFSVAWWKEHSKEIPDLVLSPDPYWNRVMLDLCQRHGGSPLPEQCYVAPYTGPKQKIPPRELYNEHHFTVYETTRGLTSIFPKASDQVSCTVINHNALLPFGYNPSLVRWNNRWLMAYRWHNQGDYSTALAISELDDYFNVKSTKQVQLPHNGGSEEDAKFFVHDGKLHLSYVDSTYPTMPPKAVVRYGELVEESAWTIPDVKQPALPGNDGTTCQKNYVFFSHGGNLYCIYSASPHRVFKLGETIEELTAPALRWPYGEPRGGTEPIPFNGKALRFFHSGLDNEGAPYRRRYYVGAMVVEPEPPFAPIAISKAPIVCGSELDDLSIQERASCIHFKAKVVFPCGVIHNATEAFLSIGINDCRCAVLKIPLTQEALKL